MKRSYKFIFVAIGLIATGFVMDGLIFNIPFSTNPQITNVSIEPNSNYSFKVNSKGETQMSGLFISNPPGIKIGLQVISSNGDVIWEGKSRPTGPEAKSQFIVSNFFNPYPKGSVNGIITNLGNQQVTITDGGLHDEVDMMQYETDLDASYDVFFEMFWYVAVSLLLKLIGIVVGIVGVILFFKERKSLKN